MRAHAVKSVFRYSGVMLLGLFIIGLFYVSRLLYKFNDVEVDHQNIKNFVIPPENMSGIYRDDRVVIDVYYESLCPDSKSFILHELLPVARVLSHVIKVNLKPYGKAETYYGKTVTFTCQHGPPECHGNMIHACGIFYSKSSKEEIDYVSCLFKQLKRPEEDVETAGKKCAHVLGLSWNQILSCATGQHGIQMMEQYGVETHALKPTVTFIPTIVINDSRDEMREALKNLKKVVCRLYQGRTPGPCR